MKKILIIFILLLGFVLTSCANRYNSCAIGTGALFGAGVGALIDHNNRYRGALIGEGIGAAYGAMSSGCYQCR